MCNVRSAYLHTLFLLLLVVSLFLPPEVISAEEATVQLRPLFRTEQKSLTIVDAVLLAKRNYPRILQGQAEVRAAEKDVSVQRIKEYNPDSLIGYQDVVATHNRLTQTLFSTPALPTTPGPGPENIQMNAMVFSAAGFIIDWAPIDFGLHKAKIDLAKAQLGLAKARYGVTIFDVAVEAASKYLDALVMHEQVAVAQANVQRFADFSTIVHAQVEAGLKPGADASLADAQLANARNDLIRARLNDELARASLAYITGSGGELANIDPSGIMLITEPPIPDRVLPDFERHPLALAGQAVISTTLARKRILDKEYYPKLRWLAGMNLRGTTFNNNRGDVESPNVSGIFPVVPNWNVGVMVELPFFDIIRIRAEKKVVFERITAAQRAYDLVIQGLKTDDVQSRVKVRAAVELADNMPVQVEAAMMAARQAQARYAAGLATVAQVAEANQILADSRVKLAVANIGVWRALLSVAAVHGDLAPFLAEAESARKRGKQ